MLFCCPDFLEMGGSLLRADLRTLEMCGKLFFWRIENQHPPHAHQHQGKGGGGGFEDRNASKSLVSCSIWSQNM